MDSNNGGMKPRITDTEEIREIVERMKDDGVQPEDIQNRIVRIAIVDLDELNAVLRAA